MRVQTAGANPKTVEVDETGEGTYKDEDGNTYTLEGHVGEFTYVTQDGVEGEVSTQPSPADNAEAQAEWAAKAEEAEQGEVGASTETVVPEGLNATPAAVELAASEGIDITTVSGSGKDGRIIASDVEAAADAAEAAGSNEELVTEDTVNYSGEAPA